MPSSTSKENIYVWGHGPLNGQSEIVDGSTAAFSVEDVPPETYVEVRTLFPSALITSGPKASGNALERVKNEEKSFQDATVLKQRTRLGILIAIPVIIISWILFWYYIWWREGREHFAGVPKYIHNPPSKLEPALVEALITQGGRASVNAFSATILDLARKKHIKIEAQQNLSKGFLGIGAGMKYKYILHKNNATSKKSLKGFEKDVLDFVFSFSENGKSVSVEEIKSGMKNQPISTRSFFKTWQETIKGEFHKLGHIEPESKKWRTIFAVSNAVFIVVMGLILAGIAHIILYTFIHIIIFGGVWGVIIFAAMGNAYLRWTKAASREAFEWLAFKHYLNDFSRFKSEIPQALIIWEEMLVYGTVFGIAKKVSEYLPLILAYKGAHAPVWYYYSSTGAGGGNISDSVTGIGLDFSTSFSQSMSDMSKSFSSSFSSGSGGSFSGGGGGGAS